MSIFDRRYRMPETDELTPEKAMQKIKESREFAAGCGFDPAKLHCRGCINSCLLSRTRCDFGKRLAEAIKQ